MTRLISIAVLGLLLGPVLLYSQTPINLGFQGGINLANAKITPDISTSTRTGFMGGAVLEVEFSDIFSVQPEVLYIQKGAKYSDVMPVPSVGDVPFDATFKFDYIEIPVLLKATFGSSSFRPFVFAGPNVGFKMKSELEIEAMGQAATQDLKDETESIDFAIDFGAGGEFKIAKVTTVFASVRYSLGLTDVIKDPDASAKTTGIQIMVGAMWGL
jgi:hypothetical protein